METGLRNAFGLLFQTSIYISLITIAIVVKYIIFAMAMTIQTPLKKGTSSKVDDSVAIFYIYVAYTTILLFKNGVFIQTIVAMSYFFWWIAFLNNKKEMNIVTLIVFLVTMLGVWIICYTLIPDYVSNGMRVDLLLKGLLTEAFFKNLLVAEVVLTIILCLGISFILDMENKLRFFVNSLLSTVIVYGSCVLLVVLGLLLNKYVDDSPNSWMLFRNSLFK